MYSIIMYWYRPYTHKNRLDAVNSEHSLSNLKVVHIPIYFFILLLHFKYFKCPRNWVHKILVFSKAQTHYYFPWGERQDLDNRILAHFYLYKSSYLNKWIVYADLFHQCATGGVWKKDVHGGGSRKRHKAYWKTTKCPLQMGPIQNQ